MGSRDGGWQLSCLSSTPSFKKQNTKKYWRATSGESSMSAKPIRMSLKKLLRYYRQHFVFYPSHPIRRLFTASRYGKRRRVSHNWRHNLLPPAEPSGLVPVVFASLSFSHLSSFSVFFFLFFFRFGYSLLIFFFSPLGLASAAKSTSGITASSSFFFFFCVLVSWFSFSLCFISPGLRSQRTHSAQLVNDCRSKCTGDLLPSDTTRAQHRSTFQLIQVSPLLLLETLCK